MTDALIAALATVAAQVPAEQADAFFAVLTVFAITALYLPACLLSHCAAWVLRRLPPKPRRWPCKSLDNLGEW